MKNKVLIIIGIICIVSILTGCTSINKVVDRTFRNVYIDSITLMNGGYKEDPYIVKFTDGRSIDMVIDTNIHLIDTSREIEFITFTTSMKYRNAYDIKDFKYTKLD